MDAASSHIFRHRRLAPWGQPYQYLNFADTNGKGKMRKEKRFQLRDLNSVGFLCSRTLS